LRTLAQSLLQALPISRLSSLVIGVFLAGEVIHPLRLRRHGIHFVGRRPSAVRQPPGVGFDPGAQAFSFTFG
jgi:hypothetical protein